MYVRYNENVWMKQTCSVFIVIMEVGGLTIVYVSHDEANGILWGAHLPTTVAVDGDLYATHHTILAASNLTAEF